MYLFIAFCAVFIYHVYSEEHNRRERKDMLNRIMSKNYQEYQYYAKKYPVDVKEVEALRNEARDVRGASPMTEQNFERPVDPEVKQFLEGTEVDWNPEEVDVDKLKEMLSERTDITENRK